jgi:hypothetical protein
VNLISHLVQRHRDPPAGGRPVRLARPRAPLGDHPPGPPGRAGGVRLDLPDRLALLGLEHVLGPAGRPVARQGQLVAVAEPGLESRADRLH